VRRALHGDLGGGRRGRGGRPIVALLKKIAEAIKIGAGTDRRRGHGPAGHEGRAREKVKGYVDLGVKEGARLVVDGREFVKVKGHENGFFLGTCLFDNVTPAMASTRTRSSARC
jgi:malonate-semialdehyde dehydrogenase (acetylating)/methylmalonate-semialdehyde dehydrogenase